MLIRHTRVDLGCGSTRTPLLPGLTGLRLRGALPGEGVESPLKRGEPLLQIRDLVPPGDGEAPQNRLDEARRLPLEPRQDLHPARVEVAHHPRAALAEICREPSGLRQGDG